ncbi:MAG: hypothetical protein IID46_15990 [Planctomycetes bacterium]|nr:hypothetical protein [Planctomycetota bacterium]
MKKSEIKVGSFYSARVSGVYVTVRVNEISTTYCYQDFKAGTDYHVTNLLTGRKLTFQSARKFRMEVSESGVPV